VVSLSTVGERFWSKVDKGPECWLWTASTFNTGRGQFKVGVRNQQAHRIAWELIFHMPPRGLLRSRCGNLLCVRPDHQVVVERKVGASNLARTAGTRFAAMVLTGPTCWNWSGSTDHLGYGQFGVMVPGGGRKMVRAHRFAWEQASGVIPDGVDVLHVCGNRICVRPDHLTLRDPAEKGRLPTARQLQILKVWVELGMKWKSHARIAAKVGVRPQTVAAQLYLLRKRLGAASTRDAVQWLDTHRPDWRAPESP
jgi:DNA-binding CsgD family transcriptional regulator